MAHFERRLLDELDASRKLAELVVGATRVGEDLDAVQAHINVGSAGGKGQRFDGVGEVSAPKLTRWA